MSTINIPVVAYLAYGSTANFRFRGRIAKINISKEWQGYGDRSSPRLLEIDPVILKVIAIFPGAKICNKLLVSKTLTMLQAIVTFCGKLLPRYYE